MITWSATTLTIKPCISLALQGGGIKAFKGSAKPPAHISDRKNTRT